MAVKYVGKREFTDEFGNTITMDMIQKKYDGIDKKGWRRVVLSDMLEVLEQIGNKKIKVLEYLIDNMNGNNEIHLSQREIVENTGISIQTVNTTLQALVDTNLIKKIKHKYVLNTQIVSVFGSTEKNAMLCIQYGFSESANHIEESDAEKLQRLERQVHILKSKLNSSKIKQENPDIEE